MPLRLDNAKRRCPHDHSNPQQKTFKSRFQIDRAARSVPQTNQPERLAPGRDQIGKVGDFVSESPGDFKSVPPGDFVGIRTGW